MADLLGKNGIFISDDARESLNIEISQEDFNKLKEYVNKNYDPEEPRKCYLTGKVVKTKEGVFIDSKWAADAIEKSLESQEKLWREFKEKDLVVCSNCGFKYNYKIYAECPNCGNKININKYRKSIKLSFVRKNTIRIYIKYLRGKIFRK